MCYENALQLPKFLVCQGPKLYCVPPYVATENDHTLKSRFTATKNIAEILPAGIASLEASSLSGADALSVAFVWALGAAFVCAGAALESTESKLNHSSGKAVNFDVKAKHNAEK